MPGQPGAQNESFRLGEATIDEMHPAIRAGAITCVQIVQHLRGSTAEKACYVKRAFVPSML